MERSTDLLLRMIAYERGYPQRIQHFLKVFAWARLMGEIEGLDQNQRLILEAAAIVHDIGIGPSLEKYGSAAGKYQEAEGPPLARAMLEEAGYSPQVVSRVCYLVGHHHTYDKIRGLDYQILVEADFLVNIFENDLAPQAVQKIRETIFRTASGQAILAELYRERG